MLIKNKIEKTKDGFFKIGEFFLESKKYNDYSESGIDYIINGESKGFILVNNQEHVLMEILSDYILNIKGYDVIYVLVADYIDLNDDSWSHTFGYRYTFLSVDTLKEIVFQVKKTNDIIYRIIPKVGEKFLNSIFLLPELEKNYVEEYVKVRVIKENYAYNAMSIEESNIEFYYNYNKIIDREGYRNINYGMFNGEIGENGIINDYYININTLEKLEINNNFRGKSNYICNIIDEIILGNNTFLKIIDDDYRTFLVNKFTLIPVTIIGTNKVIKEIPYNSKTIYRFGREFIEVETLDNIILFIDPYTLEKKPFYLP